MKPSRFLSSLLLLPAVAPLLCLLRPVSAAVSESPSPSASGIAFIQTSCNATTYPDVCYASLRRYADAVRQDHYRLASIALAVSLAQARNLTYIVNSGYGQSAYSGDTLVSGALRDCSSQLRDAVDEIHDSQKQMRQIAKGNATATAAAAAGGSSLAFSVSNVLTWMSAALTDQATCTDGFEDVADVPVKRKVCDGVTWASKHTSNALALVSLYGKSVGAIV